MNILNDNNPQTMTTQALALCMIEFIRTGECGQAMVSAGYCLDAPCLIPTGGVRSTSSGASLYLFRR
jgi:hypothetical protein